VHPRHVLLALVLVVLFGHTAVAAELEPRTVQAYDAYAGKAIRAFQSRVDGGLRQAPARHGILSAGPGQGDGINGLPGGLVHHYRGTAFIRGATLKDVLAVSYAYADYRGIYKATVASRLLGKDGDTYRILMRIREGGAGITAVLDVRSTVRYVFPSARSAYAVSTSDEIREVRNAGKSDEQLLPAGRDNGYLWRASTFTWFVERDDGVYVELETLGLSRQFPPLLNWIIEPIARRLGRTSVERTLQEFLAAVAAR
jgi:hypothetical protein